MELKRFESFFNDNGGFIYQLIQAGVIDRAAANSTDLVSKINAERDATTLDYLLPLVNDF
jgi:hypothetical protein